MPDRPEKAHVERLLSQHWSYTVDANSDAWLCECGAVIWGGRECDDDRDLDDEMRSHVADVLVTTPPGSAGAS